MKYSNELLLLGKEAKEAAKVLASLDSEDRNRSLYKIAENLMANKEQILIANKKDCEEAINNGLDDSLIDRIYLDDKRLSDIANDVITIAELTDPLQEVFDMKSLPNGLRIEKRRVPLGVIGAIYENRPNVTVDFSALCIKSGNSVILRGGKEGILTNIALSVLIRDSLVDTGVNKNIVQIIKSTNRDLVNQMLNMKDYIDLIIPRGGSKLVNMVANESRIPAITGGIGVCHIYVDEYADIDMAISIVNNAKVNRPSVCNAMDTLLINKKIYQELGNTNIQFISSSFFMTILWIFNIGTGIILLERYFPEIKDKTAKNFLYLIIGLGHLIAIILMFSERVSPNLVFCFIANIISFSCSLLYYIIRERLAEK